MNSPAELLAAIAADPEADAPRLALADWWEANGEAERAEFTRVLVRRHSFECDTFTPEEESRYHQLITLQWQREWHKERPELPGVSWHSHRGLYEQVSFGSLKCFEENAAAVFAHPPVTQVTFWNLRSTAKLFASPWLEHLGGLHLAGLSPKAVPLESVRILAQSPAARNLRYLALPATSEITGILETIARSPHLSHLRTLGLGDPSHRAVENPSVLEAVPALPPRLHTLQMMNLRIAPVAARDLWAAIPSLPLALLMLRHTHLDAAAMRGWPAGRMPALRILNLSANPFGADGVAALSAQPSDVRRLMLDATQMNDAGLAHLVPERWPQLRVLTLADNTIGDAAFGRWVHAGIWPHLATLTVDRNRIGDGGVWELGRSPHFPALRSFGTYGLPARNEILERVRGRFAEGRPPLEGPLPRPATVLADPVSLPEEHVDEDGLLEAMIAAPHDPVPRLVYADWLEEQGETERAALMRSPEPPDETLLARLTPDLKANDLGGALVHTRFERGLLHVSLQMRGMLAKTFQRDGAEWLRRHRVFCVHLLGSTKQWAKIAAMPWLRQMRVLALDNGSLQDGDLEVLLASPHLQRLMGLDLPNNQIYRRIDAILKATTLPQLCMLYLHSNYVHSGTIAQLVAWQPRKKLRILDLTYNNVGDSLGLLADHPHLDELTHLLVGGNRFGSRGLRALLNGSRLPSLTHLDLSFNDLGDEGMRLLAESPLLARLRWLNLHLNDATPDAILALARSPRFPATGQLQLYRYDFDEPTRERLREILGDRLLLE